MPLYAAFMKSHQRMVAQFTQRDYYTIGSHIAVMVNTNQTTKCTQTDLPEEWTPEPDRPLDLGGGADALVNAPLGLR